MTAQEAIEAVRRNERVTCEFSVHPCEVTNPNGCDHWWRTLFCDGGDLDVVECYHCGRQMVCRCDFDEEFA